MNKIDKEYNDCLVEKSLLYENIKEWIKINKNTKNNIKVFFVNVFNPKFKYKKNRIKELNIKK